MSDDISSPPEFRPPYRYETSEHGPVTIYDALDVGWIARVKESLPHKEALAAAMVAGLNAASSAAARSRPSPRFITFEWAYFPGGRPRPHTVEKSVPFAFSESRKTWFCSQCGVEIAVGSERWTAEACCFNLCLPCAENPS